MRHKFKSVEGAVRRIRQLEKIVVDCSGLLKRFDDERKSLAMLAADGPCFFNPLVAMEAKQLRDELLRQMKLNPDGTFINGGKS